MRRVICDIFVIITTITAPPPAKDPAKDPAKEPVIDDLSTNLSTVRQAASPPAEPPQAVDGAIQQWIIYQEFTIVHCQRDPATDQTVIDCNSESFTTNFSNDSSQEA